MQSRIESIEERLTRAAHSLERSAPALSPRTHGRVRRFIVPYSLGAVLVIGAMLLVYRFGFKSESRVETTGDSKVGLQVPNPSGQPDFVGVVTCSHQADNCGRGGPPFALVVEVDDQFEAPDVSQAIVVLAPEAKVVDAENRVLSVDDRIDGWEVSVWLDDRYSILQSNPPVVTAGYIQKRS